MDGTYKRATQPVLKSNAMLISKKCFKTLLQICNINDDVNS